MCSFATCLELLCRCTVFLPHPVGINGPVQFFSLFGDWTIFLLHPVGTCSGKRATFLHLFSNCTVFLPHRVWSAARVSVQLFRTFWRLHCFFLPHAVGTCISKGAPFLHTPCNCTVLLPHPIGTYVCSTTEVSVQANFCAMTPFSSLYLTKCRHVLMYVCECRTFLCNFFVIALNFSLNLRVSRLCCVAHVSVQFFRMVLRFSASPCE